MKVFLNQKKIVPTPTDNKNSSNASLINEILIKQKKNKEMIMEEKINKIVNDIRQKISEGRQQQKISLKEIKDIENIIDFILSRNNRKPNDIVILSQYLMSFSNFLEILSLQDKFNDTSDLIYKISSCLKKEEIQKNEIIFLNGQLGKTFYLIIQGEVSVLIPIQYSVKITCSQFYLYMQFLLEHKEYELIRRAFQSNKQLLRERSIQNINEYEKFLGLLDTNLPAGAKYEPIEIEKYMNKFTRFVNRILERNAKLEEEERKRKEEEEKKRKEEEENEDSDEEEKEKIKKIKKNKKENDDNNKYNQIKYTFYLWKYNIVCNLDKGKSFGEVALQKGDNRRTATIITKTDCVFGILEKDDYQVLIKEYMEKARKINTQALLNSKLFYNYREDLFDTHYFNCFKATKRHKSEYLFKQNDKREFIYFIKKGDVQIEHISTWKELDKIIETLGNQSLSEKKVLNDLILSSEKLKNFTQKKQKFNISICSSGEIVGFEEHIYPNTDTFMFSAICLCECEIFSLEIHFIEKMISEKLILDNYNKLIYEKKSKLYKRLLNLKSNILYHYNNLIKEKFIKREKKKLIKSREKHSERIFKSKNKLNIKKKMIYFSPEIKMEISNQSLERKNINKETTVMRLTLQNNKTNNSSVFTSINSKQRKTHEKHNLKLRTMYDADNDNQSSHRETKSKFYHTNTISNLYRIMHPVSNINIRHNRNLKNIKDFSQTVKSLNNRSLSKKAKIKFNLKGRVPNLLYDHANAFNKVIDKLISKEKDLYNLSAETRKKVNKENNKDEFSRNANINKDFISHLELLGVDKVLNSLIIKNKKKNFENKNENLKNIGKLKLMPLTTSTNFKYKYNI